MQQLEPRVHRRNMQKISTWLTEYKNAIRQHDLRSLAVKHTDDTGHQFNWDDAKLLGQSKTHHAREFMVQHRLQNYRQAY